MFGNLNQQTKQTGGYDELSEKGTAKFTGIKVEKKRFAKSLKDYSK